MRSTFTTSTLVLGLAMLPGAALAQEGPPRESILTGKELRDLVSDHVAKQRAERSAIERFLGRDDVRRVAEEAGIELRDVRSAVASLDEDEVRRLAPRVRDAEAALAGGDTLVISSTAVIIGLLILIIILVA